MINHSFYIPLPSDRKSLVTVRLLSSRNEFLTEFAEFSGGITNRNAVSFQLESSETEEKQSLIMLNLAVADIETVRHEVLHALHWAHSDKFGQFRLSVVDETAEEDFLQAYEDLSLHVIRFIEQRINHDLPYIHGSVAEQNFQEPIPQSIRDLLQE